MTFYLDTSLVVAALTPETATERAQVWLDGRDPGSLVISEWVTTEFSAALSIKLRTGHMSAGNRADALARFALLSADTFSVLAVSGSQFRAAARLADQYALGLRAGDALHLAICADHGATLCTLDRRLGEAGPALGVKTMQL
ncbi:MAG: type II toxin-antitoxin system VapC family toxin [Acetobacteraceae bacterium]